MSQGHSVQWQHLNDMGYADIMWHDYQGELDMTERKKAGEYLSKPEAVEEQLHRQIDLGVAVRYRLAIEGAFMATQDGTVALSPSKDGSILYRDYHSKRSYASVMSKLIGFEEAGVTVHMVPSTRELAALMVLLYNRAQAPHVPTTFQQHIKIVPHIKEYDPYVLTLMGVHNGGVGEPTAKALLREMDTPIEVFNSSVDAIARTIIDKKPVGTARAKQLVRALGRDV